MNKQIKDILKYSFIANVLGIIQYATNVLNNLGIPDRYASFICGVLLSIGILMLFIAIIVTLIYLKKIFDNFFPDKKDHSLWQFIIERVFNKKKENVPDDLFKLIGCLLIDIDEMNDTIKKIDQSKLTKGIYSMYHGIFFRYLVSFVNLFNRYYNHNITIRFYLPSETKNKRFLKEYVSYGNLEDGGQQNNNIYILHSCRKNREPEDYALNARSYYNQYYDKGYMKNSIFDYLTDNEYKHWNSNNLKDDINNKRIFMSCYSNDYKYNSLAVFRIVDSFEDYENIDSNQLDTIGILTIESPDINAFANSEFKDNIQSMIIMLHFAFNQIKRR